MLLEWLEPVSPVVPARQNIGWTYVDMPESSMCADGENCWYRFSGLDLGYSAGTQNSLSFARYRYCTQIIIMIQLYTNTIRHGIQLGT